MHNMAKLFSMTWGEALTQFAYNFQTNTRRRKTIHWKIVQKIQFYHSVRDNACIVKRVEPQSISKWNFESTSYQVSQSTSHTLIAKIVCVWLKSISKIHIDSIKPALQKKTTLLHQTDKTRNWKLSLTVYIETLLEAFLYLQNQSEQQMHLCIF